jgi:ketosteroid isomerase-like protein
VKENDMADATTRLVNAYYAYWGRGEFDRLKTILADDFQFRGALDAADGPAEFVDLIERNAPMFGDVTFADVRRIVDGPRLVNLYTFEAGAARVPMAEAFEVRGGRIARIDLYFDPARLTPPVSG